MYNIRRTGRFGLESETLSCFGAVKKEVIDMHFRDMLYERVSYEEIEKRYQKLQEDFQNAPDDQARMEVLRERYRLMEDLTSMELCYVRHDMNVNDPFYAAEQDYYDAIGPMISDLSSRFDKALLEPAHRAWLEAALGHQAVMMMESSQKGFDSSLIPLLQEENNMLNRYNQLVSNATILWQGKEIKRSLLSCYTQSDDRNVRKKASLAVADSWESQREELEDIYDRLVKNRNRQAKLLGFRNYVELSYYRMNRIGYTSREVSRFRDAVKKHLVPYLESQEECRRIRLGLEHLYYYDNGISFPDGDPRPEGDTQACLEATRAMYARLSPETKEFINFLLDNGLYDVEIRPGKRDGGYMTSFEKYRSPFIFANFDGTRENAYIMCHEGGHAFQYYLKRDEEIREKCSYTSETAETHAMSMEFFAWPYMELFFGDRACDYRTLHLEEALRLIARECQQDEFQQLVYEQPDMGKQERNALWHRLEKEYFPFRDNAGNRYLQMGCGWQQIPHMYQWPFYAIDYALAQMCALEYLQWMASDHAGAWKSYLGFCRETGTKSFPELVRDAGLEDPFAEGTLKKLMDWLSTTDEGKEKIKRRGNTGGNK